MKRKIQKRRGKSQERTVLTCAVPKLIKGLESCPVKFIIWLEYDSKKLIIGGDPSRLLNSAVSRHLPIHCLVIRKLQVVRSALRSASDEDGEKNSRVNYRIYKWLGRPRMLTEGLLRYRSRRKLCEPVRSTDHKRSNGIRSLWGTVQASWVMRMCRSGF